MLGGDALVGEDGVLAAAGAVRGCGTVRFTVAADGVSLDDLFFEPACACDGFHGQDSHAQAKTATTKVMPPDHAHAPTISSQRVSRIQIPPTPDRNAAAKSIPEMMNSQRDKGPSKGVVSVARSLCSR